MARAIFPLDGETESGAKLMQAAALIGEVCEEFSDDIYGGEDGQYYYSAAGGGSLELLHLAARLILAEVCRKE